MKQVSSNFRGLWLTDFDGTIKPEREPVAPADLAALKRLGTAGWFRVVATGRSLFGFVKAWPQGLEMDALIFASGAGLCAWGPMGPGSLLVARVFTPGEASAVLRAVRSLGYAFFAYHAPPDNHHFYYCRSAAAPLGFERRLEIFAAQASPWSDSCLADGSAEAISQVLVMVPADQADQAESVFNSCAPGFSVVRSSSPFADQHLWLEIFPAGVSKGRAAADLAARLGLTAAQAVALGNDYNDSDLLAWAGRALVTNDARPELLALYPAIPNAGQGGLAWAADKIMAEDGHD